MIGIRVIDSILSPMLCQIKEMTMKSITQCRRFYEQDERNCNANRKKLKLAKEIDIFNYTQ